MILHVSQRGFGGVAVLQNLTRAFLQVFGRIFARKLLRSVCAGHLIVCWDCTLQKFGPDMAVRYFPASTYHIVSPRLLDMEG